MERAVLPLLVAFALLGCDRGSKTQVPGGGTLDVMPAQYAEGSDAPQEIRKKCKFEQKVAEQVADNVEGGKVSASGSGGKVLTLTIVTMRGVDPAFQGDRRVILDGELRDGGTLAGSFRVTRSAPGGLLGGVNDVCLSLKNVAEQMGEDIAEFLADPKEGAEL